MLQRILDWSEVWALCIPLFVINKQSVYLLKPIFVYVTIAFLMNLSGNIIADYKEELHLPEWLQQNTFLYNLHSILRYACFTIFFAGIKVPFVVKFNRYISEFLLLFIIINFSVFEKFNSNEHISGLLLSIEAFILLVYCISYYLHNLNEEQQNERYSADFWIVTGLSIYVVINFFVFLFYVPLIDSNIGLAEKIWDIHNIAYIVFCIFIAKGFYEGR
ncbi:hypothetical protein DC498_02520 [Terrimonas sp.]|nr:hypothetical protein DC498_02520 [Terrimonas sp.]